MPTKAEDTVRKDVLYPDEQAGNGFIPSPGQLNGEIVYWLSEEDGDDLPDDARYGWWLPVDAVGRDWSGWLAAPRQLREDLLEEAVEPGDAFRVVSVEPGPEDHDEHQYEIEYPYEP